jgi:hypothetical protein
MLMVVCLSTWVEINKDPQYPEDLLLLRDSSFFKLLFQLLLQNSSFFKLLFLLFDQKYDVFVIKVIMFWQIQLTLIKPQLLGKPNKTPNSIAGTWCICIIHIIAMNNFNHDKFGGTTRFLLNQFLLCQIMAKFTIRRNIVVCWED